MSRASSLDRRGRRTPPRRSRRARYLSIPWLAALIVAAQSLAGLLHRPAVTRALDRATGAVLVGAALRLAAEGRR